MGKWRNGKSDAMADFFTCVNKSFLGLSDLPWHYTGVYGLPYLLNFRDIIPNNMSFKRFLEC